MLSAFGFYTEYYPPPPKAAVVWTVDHQEVTEVNKMNYLVTLHLLPPQNCLAEVKVLAGIKDLNIDENYGLVLISPKRNLYVIRVSGDLDQQQLMAVQPLIKGIHGDVKISPTQP